MKHMETSFIFSATGIRAFREWSHVLLKNWSMCRDRVSGFGFRVDMPSHHQVRCKRRHEIVHVGTLNNVHASVLLEPIQTEWGFQRFHLKSLS